MLNYKITQIINSGRYGVVHKGLDVGCDRWVAIKRFPIVRQDIPFARAQDIANREESNWKLVTGHRNVVSIHDVFHHDNAIHFVMELCKGSLADLKIQHASNVQHVLNDVLSGLVHCHESNIIHGDIKPANILLGEDGAWKLADFGNSFICLEESDALNVPRGTPSFLSPEIFEGTGYGKNADVWAIGVMTYYMFTGCMPFDGMTYGEIYRQVRCVHPRYEMFDCDMTVDFLTRCLEKDNKKRWNSKDALKHPFVCG